MHYFSNLFDKILYMFQTGPLSIIRCISTLYTRSRYLSCQFCWLSASVNRMDHADSQQNQHDKYLLHLYSAEILPIMDSGPVRNMQSILSNKFEKLCISPNFIIRICYSILGAFCWFIRYDQFSHAQSCSPISLPVQCFPGFIYETSVMYVLTFRRRNFLLNFSTSCI